jgi:FMN phosphatase YigB (HAD superfamily)
VLFVDDQPLNVDGGKQVGFDSVWFDIANATTSWASIAATLDL